MYPNRKELIHYSRKHLAHFKCPNKITFMNELQKTASGIIQKLHLRETI
ncbi:AMP-binding enzyme [Virgibacillus tibetensis]